MSYTSVIDNLRRSGNFRIIPTEDSGEVTDLSANDYLGIASDKSFRQEFLKRAIKEDIPLTSSASRLLSGHQREYHALESRLSELYGGREVLLLNSGYHANTGIIPALAEGKTLIVADRLSHASIIDGIVLSRVSFERYRHNDYEHLRNILERKAREFERIIIVTESVFSMDGDRSDINELVRVKREFPGVMLYVDEAHAFGVEGPEGLGLVNASPGSEEVDVIIGTFGKAAASEGAFAAVSPGFRDIIVNRARSLIFSTALAPINVAWTHAVVNRMIGMDTERRHLRYLADMLCKIISSVTGVEGISSHIQPLIVGDATRAVAFSRRLNEEGFKVLPIRKPTVPQGTERLRFSLSAAIKEKELERLSGVLRKCMNEI